MVRKYVRKTGKAGGRPARKYVAKRKYVPKRRVYKRRMSNMSMIKVRNDGIGRTYDTYYEGVNSFQRRMLKRYSSGAMNTYQQIVPKQIGYSNTAQGSNTFSIFSSSDLYFALQSVTQQPTSAAGSITNTKRSFFGTYTSELLMTNSSNAQMEVDIYFFKCIRDCGASTNTLWFSGLLDESNQTTTQYATYWNANPLDSQSLRSFWKCKKIIRNILQPGQVHCQKVTVHKNCPLNNETINSQNSSANYLRGWSYDILIVARGIPCSATGNSGVSTTTGNLDVVQSETYKFKYISDNDANYSLSYTANFGTGGNVYNQGTGLSATTTAI